ncbi:GGDEF domain-containing protein [Pimelobacter simplex]|uniref:Diguanylate cyclase/phosphodiesterase (GGDEF & EAL domains) with PAS/PAC sensor(S) n=1 Tax=Nocardioides simplex TaxID=2045 RepID=A0A0C5XCK7_NOCSI|nr:GGDEF domain-containing protein [Pimelobacter simplex]AJR18509.1 diguanylate cyclase/phosphodiesterase (GGDEF & EAL domains) with PAS/PAC sensor(s) [Pimelobacter simplex]GEB16980.1 hypothetical protein NSI01_52950 [Pimelobacter simplex]SFM75612.1 diguanylate cyclase (GGDEF) domain-containing protein [Pimelobacter simplex]
MARRLVRAALPALGFAAAEALSVAAGRAVRVDHGEVALVWPAAAVGVLWALYVRGLGRRRAVAHAALLGLTTFTATLATGATVGLSLWFTGVNGVLAAVTAVLLTPGRRPAALREPADLARLVVAVTAGTLLSAALAVVYLAHVGHRDLPETFALFAVRNGVTALAGVALVLRLQHARWRRPVLTGPRVAETVACVVVTLAVFSRVFWVNPGEPIAFAIMLPAMWVSLRYSTTTSTLFLAAAAVCVLVGTLLDLGALQGLPAEQQALLAQGMIGSLTLVVLTLALFRDSRNALITELRHLALHDPLTGLANRTLLTERLESALAHGRPGTVAVVAIDLDGFKSVNDAWGHDEGDLLLTEIARRLAETAGPDDTVARIGGDEFVVLRPRLDDPGDLEEYVDRVRSHVARPYGQASDAPFDRITASVGLAVSERNDTPRSLLARADQAMYVVKRDTHGRPAAVRARALRVVGAPLAR